MEEWMVTFLSYSRKKENWRKVINGKFIKEN